MPDNPLKKLYGTLVKDGYDMPATYDEFATDMRDPAKLKRLYGNISKDYELPSFDQFAQDMSSGMETAGVGAHAPTEVAADTMVDPSKKKDYVTRREGSTYSWENTPTDVASPSPSTPTPSVPAAVTTSASASNVASQPTKTDPHEEALNFIRQDYLSNKEKIDRAVTATDKNPFGSVYQPKDFMDAGGPLNDLINPTGSYETLRKYTQSRLSELEAEQKEKESDLGFKYPIKGTFGGGTYRPEGVKYNQEIEAVRKQYADQKEKLLQAAQTLGFSKIYNEQLAKADPEKIESGSWLNLREAGRKAMRITSSPHDSGRNADEEVNSQERYEMQGIPLTAEQKTLTDHAGLMAARTAVEGMIAEAKKNGGPIPPALLRQQQAVQAATKKFWTDPDHDAFRKAQVIDLLSNEIAKEKGGWGMFTDFGVSDADVRKAADKVGLAKELTADIKAGDIKQRNVIGDAVEGFLGYTGKLGSFVTSAVRRELGQSNDWIQYAEGKNLKNFSTLGGAVGENPQVQNLFNPTTEVQTDPNASNFLLNKPADPSKAGKFSWNAAGILNSVANATGQLAGMAMSAEAGGAALGVENSAAMMGSLYASQYNDNFNKAKEMGIKDDRAAEGYAFIRSLTNAYVFTKLLPTEKITENILNPTSGAGKDLFNIIERKGVDGMTREAMEPVIARAIYEGAKDMGHVLTAAEIDKTAEFITDAAFKPGSTDGRDFLKESAKEGLSLALATVIPSVIGAARKAEQVSGMYKSMIWDMGSKPEEYIQKVYGQYQDGKISFPEAEKNMRVIAQMTKAVNATPDYSMQSEKNLTERQKMDYATNLTRENVLKEKLEPVKDDPAQAAPIEAEIKDLQKQRENILKNAGGEGTISVSTAERQSQGAPTAEEPKPQEPAAGPAPVEPEPGPTKPGPEPKPAPTGEAKPGPTTSGEHPVMTPAEFQALKVGDVINMETPTGKIIQDEVQATDGGEVTLKNTGVTRNQSVTDPKNVGYRFVKPVTGAQKKAEATTPASPKTPENAAEAAQRGAAPEGTVGTNIQQSEQTFSPKEAVAAAAIEARAKDLRGTPLKPYVDVIADKNATVAQKREALKGIHDQLTEPDNEAQVGQYLGKDADKIYDLAPSQETTPAPKKGMVAFAEAFPGIAREAFAQQEPFRKKFLSRNGYDFDVTDPQYKALPIETREALQTEWVNSPEFAEMNNASEQSKNKGGQDAIQEQSPVEKVLREQEKGVELPEVGGGEPSVQKPASTQEEARVDLLNRLQEAIDRNKAKPGREDVVRKLQEKKDAIEGGAPFTETDIAPDLIKEIGGKIGTFQSGQGRQPGGTGRTEPKTTQNETGTTRGSSGTSAAPGTESNRNTQGNGKTVRGETTQGRVPGSGESNTQASNAEPKNEGEPKGQSAATDEEARIREKLKQKQKAFFDALKKSRGNLNLGVDPEVIARGIDLLATYAELGIHKFSQIAREMVAAFGKDFSKEEIDALRGVYAYHRDLHPPAERAKMETTETIDNFYENELPSLLNPAPFHPLEIRLGREGKISKYVGLNSEGLPIYEDSRGVRTIPSSKGSSIYSTEPVSLAPTKTGVETWVENRRDEYKTQEELANREKPLQAETVQKLDGERNFIDQVKKAIDDNQKLTIVSLRKMATEIGIEPKDTYLQELAETAVVELARDEVAQPLSDAYKFTRLIELYKRQPSFNMRSSERVEKQQYSTPAPYSFVAGMYVGHNDPDRVFEPSAGNGLLTIYFPPGKVHVNEIDPVRLANLHRAGYGVITSQDATAPFPKGVPYGGVITNPPFGSAPEREYDGYKIKGLDEQMIINALDNMSDGGRAALIMGGHMSYDEKGRLKADRVFFNYLHNHYNVADVINIDGSLYAKQGTTFPTRLILIDGRKEMPNGAAPLRSEADNPVTTWEELYSRVQRVKNIDYGTLLQPDLDVRPGSGDPLYGDDAKNALDEIGVGGVSSGAPATTDTKVPANGGQPSDVNSRPPAAGSVGSGGRSGTGRGGSSGRTNTVVGESVPPREPRSQGTEQAGDIAPDQGAGEGGVRGDEPPQVPTNFDANRIEAEKVPYIPASRGTYGGSVIPTQMATEIERVLREVNREVGGIDNFVQKELGYPTKEAMFKVLHAEQIDGVALAIKQIQNGQGMIIGDQTGLGKGRIAASIVRWAVRQGHKPIFITEKPNLFSDFYRDMIAIGSGDLVPYIVNDKSDNSNPTITREKDGAILYKPQPAGVKRAVLAGGDLPSDVSLVMATYSQFSSNKDTPKKQMLRRLAEGNILITDESHNMSGDSNTGLFFQDVLESAKGNVYLSATFAKRPDNMPVYAVKTAMSEANMSHEELVEAIQKGGVALQEIVSAELAEAGQMLRRERDMTGVVMDYEVLEHKADEYRARMDSVTKIMRDIIDFQTTHIQPLIGAMDDEAAGEGGRAGERKGTSMAGVDNTPFASKVFQVVHQLLFAMKADDIADAALQELRANRKPIIGFSSTMESFFTHAGLTPGDTVDKADFSLSLLRGLEGTLRYTETDERGNSNPKTFSLSDLSEEGAQMYQLIRSNIQKASTGVPISPIDAMIKKIEDAGYSIKEITGRSMRLVYDSNGGGTIIARTDKDKNKIAREFNNGQLDVIMINASGSTGLSLHASVDFEDQRQRTQVSGQLELDINTEMQKRGRNDRTGQVVRGRFRYIISPVPAEKRMLMIARKKLKSLDANTTSSQTQKTSDIAVVDFLNKHGDQVVLEYLINNPVMNLALHDPLKLLAKSDEDIAEMKAHGGESNKVTGRVALLPSDQQEKFYNDVVEQYVQHIAMLESLGQNDLEVKSMPLAAKTLAKDVIIQGKGGTSPFGRDSILEKVEANVLRKPISKKDLDAEIAKGLDGKTPQEVSREHADEASDYLEGYLKRELQRLGEEYQQRRDDAPDFVEKKAAKYKNPVSAEDRAEMLSNRYAEINQAEAAAVERITRKETNLRNMIVGHMNFFRVGSVYGTPTSLNADVSSGYVPGVFLGFQIGNSTENKYRPSNISMRFATPMGSMSVIQVPLSRTNYVNAVVANTNMVPRSEWAGLVENWEKRTVRSDRQERYIVTGNILQGFNYAEGQLVSFTTDKGELRKGVLLKEDYKPEKDAVTRVPISKAAGHLQKTGTLESSNGDVKIERGSAGFLISVPASKVTGAKYYLNTDLRNLVSGRDFRQSGNKFIAQFAAAKLDDVLSILENEFGLGVNIPKLNLKTDVLPRELQRAHDEQVYGPGTVKEQNLMQARGQVEQETAGIEAAQAGATDLEKVFPRTFAQDFTEQVVQDHSGYEIKGPRDVADLFSLYRSPFIEKSHLVFVKDGKIVANHSITSNSPTETPAWHPTEVAHLASSYGANEVFLVHNHPSGNPAASELDQVITAMYGQMLPQYGITFRGQVILNGGKYSYLDQKGRSELQDYSTPQPALFSPRYEFSADPQKFQAQAVDVAHYILKDNEGQTGIVYLDPQNKVSGYDLIAPNATVEEIAETIRNGMVPNGASNYYIASSEPNRELLSATLPHGILGEISLNGGVRGGQEFKTEVRIDPPLGMQAKKTGPANFNDPRTTNVTPGANASNVAPPYTVEVQKSSRMKDFAKETKQNLADYFLVGGGIDKALRDLKEAEIGNFNEWKAKARHRQQDLAHAVKEVYPKKPTEEENAVIDKALKGDVAAMNSLDPKVQQAVTGMRDMIDELTEHLIQAGVVPDAEDIQRQIDEHMANSQAAGVEPNTKYMALLNQKLALAEKIQNNIGSYVNRAYLKFYDKNWRDHVSQQKVDAAVHYLYNEALLQGKTLSQEQAADIVNDILSAKTMDYIMNASKFAMNMGILKKMKDIPAPIRDLMGEVKEAEWNFMNTVTKMANLLERHKFLHSFRQAAEGVFMSGHKDPENGFTEQINQPTWGPLHGQWTTPELAKALKEWDGDKVDASWAVKMYRDINGLSKSMKTTLSWVSELHNLIGNVTLTAFNGNFSPTHFKKGILAIKDVFNKVQGADARAYLEKMNRLRIVGTSLPYHEIRGIVNELTAGLPELNAEDPLFIKKVWQNIVAFKNKAGEVYGATDDIYKIMTFEMEKAKLQEAYEKSGVNKTEDQVEREAAEITLRIMPTFSKVPKIVKTLSYSTPVIGTFISYPAELMRTTYNGVALAVEQLKSDNPEIRKMGAKRLAWQLGTISLPYALAGLVGLLGSVAGYAVANQDEKNAIYELLPDYYKNDNVIVWKKHGKYYVWMGSNWDGHGYLRSIFNGAIRGGENGEHHIKEAISEAMGPFAQPALPVQKVVQHIENKDQNGNKIYLEGDDQSEKSWKVFKHYGDLVSPQMAADIYKPADAFIHGNTTKGALGAIKFISGQAVMEIDPKTILTYKVNDLKQEIKDAKAKGYYDSRHGKSAQEVNEWYAGRVKEINAKAQHLEDLYKKLTQ